MALDLSALSNYVNENADQLTAAAIFSAKTASLIESKGNVQVGIKSAETINVMTTDAVFQAGGTCGFNSSGTTAITQRQLSVGKIKVQESICPKAFEAKYTQKALRQGSTYDYMAYAQEYCDQKIKRIGAALETALWQGDTSSGTANLNKFDGLSKLIVAGSPVDANVSGYTGVATISTITQSNVVAATEGIYKAIPAAVMAKGDVKIFVGNDWYRLLIMAYRALNLFSYNPQDANASSFILPATNVEVVSVNGLNGTGDAFAMSLSNIAMAVDLVDEEGAYDMWWSRDNNDVRFRVAFKMGVNVAFTNECVKFIAAI